MKISQIFTIITFSFSIIACGAKTEENKAGKNKAKSHLENPVSPSQDAILQSQMDELNKAKNAEKAMIEAKAKRDRQDKEVQGFL